MLEIRNVHRIEADGSLKEPLGGIRFKCACTMCIYIYIITDEYIYIHIYIYVYHRHIRMMHPRNTIREYIDYIGLPKRSLYWDIYSGLCRQYNVNVRGRQSLHYITPIHSQSPFVVHAQLLAIPRVHALAEKSYLEGQGLSKYTYNSYISHIVTRVIRIRIPLTKSPPTLP